ncbi:MAG: alpha-E domain-containing protein [Acidimicrobiales bacterium]|nr:alpha-E domain-containing protein [Acidimicrobiales bacterium]
MTLGSTARGLFWMFRYLERSENTARLAEAGLRIALTRAASARDEWASVLTTAGVYDRYQATYGEVDPAHAMDFLLRDERNPSSVLSVLAAARTDARAVRTALTREVWEATNTAWMAVADALSHPVSTRDLPRVLGLVRQESAFVRGALHGTMMRNDVYDFARLGTFIERADNTARILDVKYYVLLPSAMPVGSQLDNVQWETILRSVSAQSAYRWQNPGQLKPAGIAEFLILDRRMPRSLSFCFMKIMDNLGYLATDYGVDHDCHRQAAELYDTVADRSISSIFDAGLHEFLSQRITDTSRLATQIETDYRFYA